MSTTSVPFVYGTSFLLKLGLLSFTLPVLTTVTESDFSALITGIEMRGPAGESVTEFEIDSASGTNLWGSPRRSLKFLP